MLVGASAALPVSQPRDSDSYLAYTLGHSSVTVLWLLHPQEEPMAVPADRTYPKAGTNKEWQKKKTVGDKANAKTKSTGLRSALEAAEESWSKINWSRMDGSKIQAKDLAAALEKQADAEAELKDVA